MNTIAFGEEIVAEDVAADDAAVETVVEGAADADLADAEVADAELAGAMVKDKNGIGLDADNKVVTKITFESDGAKKNAKTNVAVIENTTNPISWNNYYAANLMETVFSGELNKDDYLNNRKETSVSSANPLIDLDGIEVADPDYFYQTYAVNEADGIYLLVKYGFGGKEYREDKLLIPGEDSMYVKGYDSFNEPEYANLLPKDDATTPSVLDLDVAKEIAARFERLPVTNWDGRKVAWNKDGKGVMTKSAKNVLNVNAALVKYEGNTVKEFPGVEVGSVKIDTKAIKNASVKAKASQTKLSGKYLDVTNADSPKEVTAGLYLPEHDTINTIPTFTFTVKTKNKDLKAYKKDITAATKAVGSLAFGIVQATVTVTDPLDNIVDTDANDKPDAGAYEAEYFKKNPGNHYEAVADTDTTVAKGFTQKDSYVIPASANEITDKDNGIEKNIDDGLSVWGYVDDVDNTDPISIGNGFKISKFGKDGKKATLTKTVDTYTAKGVEGTADVNIKFAKSGSTKGDFTLTKESLAGKDVYVLDFIENGNIAYAETDPRVAAAGVPSYADLSAFGYKWAFRPSPIEGNKGYRSGIFANTDEGFVFNAQ